MRRVDPKWRLDQLECYVHEFARAAHEDAARAQLDAKFGAPVGNAEVTGGGNERQPAAIAAVPNPAS